MFMAFAKLFLLSAGLCFLCSCELSHAQVKKQTDATDPSKESKFTEHKGDPIIIDNPEAFIGLIAHDDHELNLVGPIDHYDGTKSSAIVVDHLPFRYLRYSYATTQPYEDLVSLGQPKVTVHLKNNKGSGYKAGVLEITHEPNSLFGFDVVRLVSTHDDPEDEKKVLRWKRSRRSTEAASGTLGLYRENGVKHLYTVTQIDYYDSANVLKTIAFDPSHPVHIRLCSNSASKYCPEW